MKYLATLFSACALVVCLSAADVPAQSGRRPVDSQEKSFPLPMPDVPPESKGTAEAKDDSMYLCVEQKWASATAPAEPIFKGSEVVSKAVIKSKPAPGITEEARANRQGGTVRLRAVLGAEGRVTKVSVIKGLPDGLTGRAIDAACQIKFTPATIDGRPVSQYVILEYNFNFYDRRAPVFPTGPRWP